MVKDEELLPTAITKINVIWLV